jgi:DNA adenine methylase
LHEHDLARIRAGGEAVGGTHENYPYYYQVRALDPAELSDVEIAARFIYLNRTCFNGLYRVNASGKFNVPAGRYRKPAIADAANLRACEHALADTDVGVGDFASINPSPKDFVYFDPPYDPMPTEGQNESFTGYTSGGFDAADQARLRDYAVELTQQGVFVILSNHDTPRVRRLYEEESDVFEVHQIMASRAINSDAAGRGKVAEVLISNVAAVLA